MIVAENRSSLPELNDAAGAAMVRMRLEVTPSDVSDGPWAYMATEGLTFMGNVAEKTIPYATTIQRIQLTFEATNPAAKVDYSLYLDNVFKKKGTAKVVTGTNTGSLTIQFFFPKAKK